MKIIKTDEEVLGFKPLDVIDELINSVHDSVCDIIDETEQRVSPKFPTENITEVQNVTNSPYHISEFTNPRFGRDLIFFLICGVLFLINTVINLNCLHLKIHLEYHQV